MKLINQFFGDEPIKNFKINLGGGGVPKQFNTSHNITTIHYYWSAFMRIGKWD
jgi:hypothetical protein